MPGTANSSEVAVPPLSAGQPTRGLEARVHATVGVGQAASKESTHGLGPGQLGMPLSRCPGARPGAGLDLGARGRRRRNINRAPAASAVRAVRRDVAARYGRAGAVLRGMPAQRRAARCAVAMRVRQHSARRGMPLEAGRGRVVRRCALRACGASARLEVRQDSCLHQKTRVAGPVIKTGFEPPAHSNAQRGRRASALPQRHPASRRMPTTTTAQAPVP